MSIRFLAPCAVVLAAGLTLSACASGDDTTATTTASTTSETTATATETTKADAAAEDSITLEEGVVRASVEGNDMTSIFGTLHNNTDKDVTIIGFTSESLGQARYEIHEVVDGMMRQKEGGITIPAGGTHELKPGGDHFMVMEMKSQAHAGDTIDIDLLLDGGTMAHVSGVPVRDLLPGDEDYGDMAHNHGEHGGHGEGHEGMDHSEHAGH